MVEYAMIVGSSVGGAAAGAGEWASANEAVLFIAASAVILFILYQIFMRK